MIYKLRLSYRVHLSLRYQGESLIYISFPIGICFKRVPVHSYPFPYLNPLPTAVRESVRLFGYIRGCYGARYIDHRKRNERTEIGKEVDTE